jgi:hypothetical protein
VICLVLPYKKAKKFFDTFDEHKNEDNYAVCSFPYAYRAAGIPKATAALLLKRFEEMGCIQLYEKRYTRNEQDGPSYKIEGTVVYRLVKILKPFTRKDYLDYWSEYEEVTVVSMLRKH